MIPPCGTTAAYHRHLKRAEKPCESCFLAHREYLIQYKKSKNPGYKSRFELPPEVRNPCGTEPAYQRHRKRGEEPCTACKKAHSDRVRAYHKETGRDQRDVHQKHHYGISLAEKRLLLELQGGRCAIAATCGGAEISLSDAVTEHHHNGRKDGSAVRGIACDRCNRLLGLLGDGNSDLRSQFAALERYLAESHPLTQQRLADIRAKKSL